MRTIEVVLASAAVHRIGWALLHSLLQSVIEVLLFYHPAAWWAARIIRAEREHCCDDQAVRTCGDRLAYARALATMEGLRGSSRLSLAASGGPLLARVRRILNPEVESMDRLPILAPGAALLIGALLLSAAPAPFQQTARRAAATPEDASPRRAKIVVTQSFVRDGGADLSVQTLKTIEPRLKVAIAGEKQRFTGTIATYSVTLENPGTAPAHNVRMRATLPRTGRLVGAAPDGARWDPATAELLWTIPRVDPGEKAKVTGTFQVRMEGVGRYQVSIDARGDGGLLDHTSCWTDVSGLPDFEFEVLEQRRLVDVGDETEFSIRIKNIGTKDATHVLVSAVYSKNIELIETRNRTDDRRHAGHNMEQHMIVFPPIDRLSLGKEIVLGIKVKAKEKGLGTCRAFLIHDDVDLNEALEDMASFRITATLP